MQSRADDFTSCISFCSWLLIKDCCFISICNLFLAIYVCSFVGPVLVLFLSFFLPFCFPCSSSFPSCVLLFAFSSSVHARFATTRQTSTGMPLHSWCRTGSTEACLASRSQTGLEPGPFRDRLLKGRRAPFLLNIRIKWGETQGWSLHG